MQTEITQALNLAQAELRSCYKRLGFTSSNVLDAIDTALDKLLAPSGQTEIKSAEEITTITDECQLFFRSWTYWQFKYYNDVTTMANPGTTESFYDQYGFLQENKVRALARPYAYAICGIPLSEKLKKGIFQLTWVTSD